MSHCGTSAFYCHFNYGFIVLKHWNQNVFRLMERDECSSDRDWCAWLEFVSICSVEYLPTDFPVALLHLWFCWFGFVRNEILQSLNPKDQEQESHPCVNLHRERLLQLPWNSVKLRFVSCTSNLLAQMFGFLKCTELFLMLISSLQGLLQNQRLETTCTSQDEYCTTELYLSVDRLKKKNKQQGRQRQGRDGVSVQMSMSM